MLDHDAESEEEQNDVIFQKWKKGREVAKEGSVTAWDEIAGRHELAFSPSSLQSFSPCSRLLVFGSSKIHRSHAPSR